jgi:hypothetical protein
MNKLFEVPVGESLEISFLNYHCGICGKKEEEATFTLEATEAFNNEKTYRKWLYYHNPFCDCTKSIWLPNGPIVPG